MPTRAQGRAMATKARALAMAMATTTVGMARVCARAATGSARRSDDRRRGVHAKLPRR